MSREDSASGAQRTGGVLLLLFTTPAQELLNFSMRVFQDQILGSSGYATVCRAASCSAGYAADFNFKLRESADDGTESVHQEAQGEKSKYFCT